MEQTSLPKAVTAKQKWKVVSHTRQPDKAKASGQRPHPSKAPLQCLIEELTEDLAVGSQGTKTESQVERLVMKRSHPVHRPQWA